MAKALRVRRESVLSPSNANSGSIYLGRNFCSLMGAKPGDSLMISFVGDDAGSAAVEPSQGTLATSWVVGGQTDSMRTLGLEGGATLELESVVDSLQITARVLSESGDNRYVDTRNEMADSFQVNARGRRVAIYGLGTGTAGVKGGVNTANDLLLKSLQQAVVEAEALTIKRVVVASASHDAPLETPAATEPPTSDGGLVTISFAQMIAELLTDYADDENAIIIVIGHDLVTGPHAADAIEVARQRWSEYEHQFRRVHFVHTAPMQIAAARGGAVEGSRAVQKLQKQRQLLRTSDLRVFVGNSATDFPEYWPPSDQGKESLPVDGVIVNYLFPVATEQEPKRTWRDPYVRVMAFGRLDDEDVKGVSTVMKAMDLIGTFRTTDHRRLQLQLVGSGGSAKQVMDSGPLVEIPYLAYEEALRLVPGCSMVLLPSEADSLGLVALEALALGRPCLVSDAAGISSGYRRNNRHEWVVSAGQPDEWAEAIKRLANENSDGLTHAALGLSTALLEESLGANSELGQAVQRWIDFTNELEPTAD